MKRLSIILFIVLTMIAGLHVYWAAGGLWPGASERELIDTVIGSPDFLRMPPAWMTLLVALLLVLAAVLALSVSGVWSIGPAWLARIGASFVALVFLARGVVGFIPSVRSQSPLSEPFATLDTVLYSPLCLAIGLGFALTAFVGRR